MRRKWSISTHKLYRVCPRKFYFSKIFASATSKDEVRTMANYLSNLQTLEMVAGNVVHRTIKEFVDQLNRGRLINEKEAINYALTLYETKLKYSEEGRYKTESRTNAGDVYCGLFEHEYEIPISEQMRRENLDIIISAISQFFRMDIETKNGLVNVITFIKNAQKRRAEDWSYRFEYEGWEVNPYIDLILEFSNGEKHIPVIIDWKIEKSWISDNSQQMQIYGYAVWKRWNSLYNTQPGDIVLLEINLLTGITKRHTFNNDDLIAIDDQLFESVREFEFILGDKKFEDFDIKEFGLTQNTNSCSYCNLKKLCVEYLQQEEKEYAANVLELF